MPFLDSETQEMKICGILCILTRPREIFNNNIPLTRKIREIGKMRMEILATVCSAAGHKNILFP
jgi:hypothetical protein